MQNIFNFFLWKNPIGTNHKMSVSLTPKYIIIYDSFCHVTHSDTHSDSYSEIIKLKHTQASTYSGTQ